jgi:SAM-dependent methyltransferase
MKAFRHYARYYNLLYADKNYAAEAGFVQGLMQKYAPGAETILELGCGTGGHAVQLAALGYELHGVDLSPEMLAMAQERLAGTPAGRLSFDQGDIRTLRVDRKFDAVVALFHVLSYQLTAADLAATFATARAHLQPGGVFLCDFWYGPAVLTARPEVRVKRMQDGVISVTRIAEPVLHANANVVDVNYQVFVQDLASGQIEEFHETHHMRYLFKPEIDVLHEAAGLTHLECAAWLTGREPGCDTWGVYSVGKL